jgi:hypothetical protein
MEASMDQRTQRAGSTTGTRRSRRHHVGIVALVVGALLVAAACTQPPQPTPPPNTLPPVTYKTKDFSAHISAIPPGPRTLIVSGTVVVGHPGHKVTLEPAAPQGINPNILLMKLTVERVEGIFPQVETEIPVRWQESPARSIERVTILPDGIDLPVMVAH